MFLQIPQTVVYVSLDMCVFMLSRPQPLHKRSGYPSVHSVAHTIDGGKGHRQRLSPVGRKCTISPRQRTRALGSTLVGGP